MKIALAQTNPVVGDVIGNTEKIIERMAAARAEGAALVLFPELSVVGYPPRDLVLKPRFVKANVEAVHRIAERCIGIAAIVGFVDVNTDAVGRRLRNAAALCRDGRMEVRYKSLLPTYDVFDEHRYFEPGPEVALVEHAGKRIGISICEDLWDDEQLVGRRLYHSDPIGQIARAGADFLVNISASPFTMGKHEYREKLFGNQARKHGLPIVFCNQVGGNDDLVFDGGSAVFDARGRVVAQAKAFEEDLLVVDLAGIETRGQRGEVERGEVGAGGSTTGSTGETPVPHPYTGETPVPHPQTGGMPVPQGAAAPPPGRDARRYSYPTGMAALHDALVLGTRDYVRKCGFKRVVLGLSGGIDSAVTAAIAAAGLGPESVVGVAMPSRYSSEHSKSDAAVLARNLGIEFRIIPIGPMHDVFETQLGQSPGEPLSDLANQNLQARIRGCTLMALSNHFGWLLLTTGNKSELAVGYTTLYGDMCGGLAVISDVPKTLVYPLARYINERAGREMIPEGSLTKAPSAELRPDQTDQDTLPPYDLLDAIVERYVNQEQSTDEIIAAGFDAQVVQKVIRWIDLNEYKRKQMPPGLKVTSRAFGVGRRMPIAARFRY